MSVNPTKNHQNWIPSITTKLYRISKKQILQQEVYQQLLSDLQNYQQQIQQGSFSSNQLLMIVLGNDLALVKKIILDAQNLILNLPTAGCTTAGNILGLQFVAGLDVVVQLNRVTHSQFHVQSFSFQSYEDSYELGRRISRSFVKDHLQALLVFSEGISINGAKLTHGLREIAVPVLGVLAGDDFKTVATYVFDQQGVHNKSVVVVALYGEHLHVVAESESGLSSFGIERKVTKSDKNILYELDHRPVLDVYSEYLGENAADKMAIHLMYSIEISENFQRKEGLIRTPLLVDPVNKCIVFTGEIPQGEFVRLLLAQTSGMIDAAAMISDSCQKQLPEPIRQNADYFSLVFSCASRCMGLGSRIEDELQTGTEDIQLESKQMGLYGYGEIVTRNQVCSLMNQTFSKVIIYED
jgi:hypothetical protein